MSDAWSDSLPPDEGVFLTLVADAISDLPAPFADHANAVAVQVLDFAPRSVLDEMGIDTRST